MDWNHIAQAVAEDAYANNFSSRRGSYLLDDEGRTFIVIYNNNPYSDPKMNRDAETTRFREELSSAGIAELGFATTRDGYSYGMILGGGEREHDVVREAYRMAVKQTEDLANGQ